MKTAVIGPGALGCLFSARLTKADISTVLVDHRRDRADRLSRNGLRIESDGATFTAQPHVAIQINPKVDWILVLTKATATRHLKFPPDVPVLTLQNGLGNAEILAELAGASCVLAGATSEAATLLGEGHVRHVAAGETRFGAWTDCDPEPIREGLARAGFSVTVSDAPGQIVWEKAAISAGINPLTALLNVPNGRLVEIPEVRQLLRDLVVEAAKVAANEGYRFDYSLVERTEAVCRATAKNISSMLQDVRAGKATEIGAISGEIMRRAQETAIPTPRTRVIWQLIRGLEAR